MSVFVFLDGDRPSLLSDPKVSLLPEVHKVLEHSALVELMTKLLEVDEVLT